jgi:dihydrofolate reductase
MSRVRVQSFSLSIDGFGAGPDQDLEHPIGVGGLEMMGWARSTRTFQAMFGADGGSTGLDDQFAQRGFANVGAWILGRNMFGPVRGSWGDESWRGWWGDNPPYHVPVFVLTHHARAPLAMEGGTTFHFVTEGILAALQKAREAAGEKDVRIGGGVATIRQYLQAGLIDELHLAMVPHVLGRGEHLLGGIDLKQLGYECTERVASDQATHVVLTKK